MDAITSNSSSKKCMDALNKSFNSIEKMIENYIPETTKQEYAVFSFSGQLYSGDVLTVGFTAQYPTLIFGVNNFSTSFEYVGQLTENKLTALKSFPYGVDIYQFVRI